MSNLPTILEMFQAGVHFGHRLSRRHPKMEPFIFAQKNGISIINLEMTQQKLREALDFVRSAVAANGQILFLGTKAQAKDVVRKSAESCQMPFVTERWLGGTFTNYAEISRVIKKFKLLKKRKAAGDLDKYTKKEQLKFNEEIGNLEVSVGGIESMEKLPAGIFIIDLKKEKTAYREALRKKIPVIAICDSNVDPSKVSYVIPGNDDAVKSVEMMCGLISQAVNEGLKEKDTTKTPVVAKEKKLKSNIK